MSDELAQAIRDVQDEQRPLTRRMLAFFSGLGRVESDAFMAGWATLTIDRQRSLLTRMVEYAEESFDLDYVWLFRRLLDHEDPTIRRHAVEGLWEDCGTDLVRPLVALLSSDSDATVRAAAAISVGRFVYLAECDELDEQRGKLLREALERVIDDPNEDLEVRRRAVESIAYINDDAVRRIIDHAYTHSDQRMRESAIFAMGRSADLIWGDTVLAELDTKSPAMRYEAARACGELQLRRAVAPLIKLVQQGDAELQSMAVWALGQIGGAKAKQALERWANSDEQVLNQAAAEALDEIEFAMRPFDLFVHEPGGPDFAEIELMAEEDEDDLAGYDQDDDADDDWADDPLDI